MPQHLVILSFWWITRQIGYARSFLSVITNFYKMLANLLKKHGMTSKSMCCGVEAVVLLLDSLNTAQRCFILWGCSVTQEKDGFVRNDAKELTRKEFSKKRTFHANANLMKRAKN
ncbi:hypothetical protein niasHT_025132 [Heterodera trifolii]|uniref:Secreted protein n=1 Tax=Heterodera trifolii TaxID=157864 RepID=A0ABD2K1E7_9BILA